MQDVDFELKYEPGRNEAGPLDFLLRHPLPETEEDHTEQIIKAITETEPAIVLSKIRDETAKASTLQKLSQVIKRGDWEANRRDPDIVDFAAIREELCEVQRLIYRLKKIALPKKLQKKIIKIAHEMGHFGKSKTKNMLRAKYWFPAMNSMIYESIDQCYECQVVTKQHTVEPIKPSTILSRPWEEICVDFGGTLPRRPLQSNSSGQENQIPRSRDCQLNIIPTDPSQVKANVWPPWHP